MTAVQGFDFDAAANAGTVDWSKLAQAYETTGLQGTEIQKSVQAVKDMFQARKEGKTKVVLAFTSNLISCGLREMFAEMAQKKLIDVVVTTAGGVEEDFIKCLGPTVLGDFALDGADLRSKGLNRIANMLVPNDNYCKFEDWMTPILNDMVKKQNDENVEWTPSRMIARLGDGINDAASFYAQCFYNDIPVFCPSLSDGSIGDMLYFHSYKMPGLILDSAADLGLAVDALQGAPTVSVLCLGGGLPKHHTLQVAKMANLPVTRMVFVNTGLHFDGSETGMTKEDDKSTGKIAAGMLAVVCTQKKGGERRGKYLTK